MARKKKVMEAGIGDLFAYLQKNTFRLRAVEGVSRMKEWAGCFASTITATRMTVMIYQSP